VDWAETIDEAKKAGVVDADTKVQEALDDFYTSNSRQIPVYELLLARHTLTPYIDLQKQLRSTGR
jgi:hypothetical protein